MRWRSLRQRQQQRAVSRRRTSAARARRLAAARLAQCGLVLVADDVTAACVKHPPSLVVVVDDLAGTSARELVLDGGEVLVVDDIAATSVEHQVL